MEDDVSGATSFSDIDLDAPQSNYTKYLDAACPYFMLYGMTWNEFWFESIDRFHDYWQRYQFDIERRNQELWLQGLYIRKAIDSAFDMKHIAKYPDKPLRITELTEEEKELEAKQMVEQLREQLNEIKRRSDARNKGVNGIDG